MEMETGHRVVNFMLLIFLFSSVNAQSTNLLNNELKFCSQENGNMIITPMLESIINSLQSIETRLQSVEEKNEKTGLVLANMKATQQRNTLALDTLTAIGGNISSPIQDNIEQFRVISSKLTQIKDEGSKRYIATERRLNTAMKNITKQINDLVVKSYGIENINRNITSQIDDMNKIQAAESERLALIENDISVVRSSVREIKQIREKDANSIQSLASRYQNLTRLESLQEDANNVLMELSSNLTGLKTDYVNNNAKTDTAFNNLRKNITREIDHAFVKSDIGSVVNAVTSHIDKLGASVRENVTSKFDTLQASYLNVTASVNLLTSSVGQKFDLMRGQSDQIKTGLGVLETDLISNKDIAQTASRHIDEMISLLKEDNNRTENFFNTFKNASQADSTLKEKLLHDLVELKSVNDLSKGNSDRILAVQLIAQQKLNNLIFGLQNLSAHELNETTEKISGIMSLINDQNNDLKVQLQQLVRKGDIQTTTLEQIVQRIKSVKEHVQSAHANVTAILDNLSEKTANISGSLSPPKETNEGTQTSPARNCASLSGKASGLYWIQPNDASSAKPFQVYCDMETDGGGWTLVYAYTFARFSSFSSGANAVTPRPTWPLTWSPTRLVTASTRTPLNETHYGAIDFRFWRNIGSEFLVKSNIGNWVSCSEDGGSLVQSRPGTLFCKVVKRVYTSCTAAIPRALKWDAVGPYISTQTGGQVYFWDSSTTSIYPTHDPCGNTASYSRFSRISNPHGNIYIR